MSTNLIPADLRCRLGLHHFVDFPDPNIETRGLEAQGYRACTRCTKEKDGKIWLPRQHINDGWFPARRGER